MLDAAGYRHWFGYFNAPRGKHDCLEIAESGVPSRDESDEMTLKVLPQKRYLACGQVELKNLRPMNRAIVSPLMCRSVG